MEGEQESAQAMPHILTKPLNNNCTALEEAGDNSDNLQSINHQDEIEKGSDNVGSTMNNSSVMGESVVVLSSGEEITAEYQSLHPELQKEEQYLPKTTKETQLKEDDDMYEIDEAIDQQIKGEKGASLSAIFDKHHQDQKPINTRGENAMEVWKMEKYQSKYTEERQTRTEVENKENILLQNNENAEIDDKGRDYEEEYEMNIFFDLDKSVDFSEASSDNKEISAEEDESIISRLLADNDGVTEKDKLIQQELQEILEGEQECTPAIPHNLSEHLDNNRTASEEEGGSIDNLQSINHQSEVKKESEDVNHTMDNSLVLGDSVVVIPRSCVNDRVTDSEELIQQELKEILEEEQESALAIPHLLNNNHRAPEAEGGSIENCQSINHQSEVEKGSEDVDSTTMDNSLVLGDSVVVIQMSSDNDEITEREKFIQQELKEILEEEQESALATLHNLSEHLDNNHIDSKEAGGSIKNLQSINHQDEIEKGSDDVDSTMDNSLVMGESVVVVEMSSGEEITEEDKSLHAELQEEEQYLLKIIKETQLEEDKIDEAIDQQLKEEKGASLSATFDKHHQDKKQINARGEEMIEVWKMEKYQSEYTEENQRRTEVENNGVSNGKEADDASELTNSPKPEKEEKKPTEIDDKSTDHSEPCLGYDSSCMSPQQHVVFGLPSEAEEKFMQLIKSESKNSYLPLHKSENIKKKIGELTEDDLKVLSENKCLIDKVIYAFLLLMQLENNERDSSSCTIHVFSEKLAYKWNEGQFDDSFQQVKLTKCTWIFIPVNVNGKHWVLLAADVRNKTVSILDSDKCDKCNGDCYKYVEYFRTFMKKHAEEGLDGGWKIGTLQSAQQNDSCSCGVYVMMNVLSLMNDIQTADLSQGCASEMRKFVLNKLRDAMSKIC